MCWAGDMLPPHIFVGQTVCGAGKIKTWGGGRSVYVVDAVPLTAGKDALKPFYALLDEQCANPLEWAPHLLQYRY